MRKTYQLIKLRTETVQNLKRLMTEMGIGSLDKLVNIMIRLTDEHRLLLREVGWKFKTEG
jgi:hypothetical protein